jgi:hypothetical protein
MRRPTKIEQVDRVFAVVYPILMAAITVYAIVHYLLTH